MANTESGRQAALSSMKHYTEALGIAPGFEDDKTIASDLITDLLLTFDDDDAAEILARVERDNAEDRSE